MTAILGCVAFVAALIIGWPVAAGIAVVAPIATLFEPRRWLVVTVVTVCAVVGAARGGEVIADRVSPSISGPYQGVVTGYARRTGDRQRFELQTVDGALLCVGASGDLLLGRGDVVRLDGTLVARVDLAPSRAAALRQLGCLGAVDADEVEVIAQGSGPMRRLDTVRRGVAEWFAKAAPGDPGALLSGLVIGDDDAMSRATKEPFYRLGMSHITAVSGSNLALLTWLLIGRGGGRRPLAIDLGTLGILWLYVMLAGAGPSTVRAGLTATLCVVVARTGRRPELLTIACLVAATQVAIDPGLIGSLAYRLSTIAMLVMISTLTGRPGTGLAGKVKQLVACSVAIQLATLPFVPSTDQAIVAGVVANILAAPLVGLAFTVAMAAALLQPVLEPAATALAIVAELPAGLVIDLVVWIEATALAEVSPAGMSWLPRQAVRLGLIALVVMGFGRHARRGVRDVRDGLAVMSATERGVWLGLVGGAALGMAATLAAR